MLAKRGGIERDNFTKSKVPVYKTKDSETAKDSFRFMGRAGSLADSFRETGRLNSCYNPDTGKRFSMAGLFEKGSKPV